jgi:hypothetical protein
MLVAYIGFTVGKQSTPIIQNTIYKGPPLQKTLFPVSPEWTSSSALTDEHSFRRFAGAAVQLKKIGSSIGDMRFTPGKYKGEASPSAHLVSLHGGSFFLSPQHAILYKKTDTGLLEHIRLSGGSKAIADASGHILIYDDAQVYTSQLSQVGDLAKLWTVKLHNGMSILDATIRDSNIYLALKTPLTPDIPCPIVLGMIDRQSSPMIASCDGIYTPSNDYAATQIVTVVQLDFSTGAVQKSITSLTNDTHNAQLAFGESYILTFHERYADGVNTLAEFMNASESAIIPSLYKNDIQKVLSYDISSQHKRNEIATLLSSYKLSLASTEANTFQYEFQKNLDSFEHSTSVPLDGTLLIARSYENFNTLWHTFVPGHMDISESFVELYDHAVVTSRVYEHKQSVKEATRIEKMHLSVIDTLGARIKSYEYMMKDTSAVHANLLGTLMAFYSTDAKNISLYDLGQPIGGSNETILIGETPSFQPVWGYTIDTAKNKSIVLSHDGKSLFINTFTRPLETTYTTQNTTQIKATNPKGFAYANNKLFVLADGKLTTFVQNLTNDTFQVVSSENYPATELIQVGGAVYMRISDIEYVQIRDIH